MIMRSYKNIGITKTVSIIGFCALLATSAYARNDDSKIALGAKIGTTGFGIEGRSPITENLYGRLGANYFHYNHKVGDSKLDYKGKLTLFSVPLMLDYHPFENSGFRLSLGVGYNGNKVTASATPNKSITLYGNTYTPQELGKVTSKLTLGSKIAPVLSIGYDSSFISDSAFSFNAELGAMYSGNPKIKVSSTGLTANNKQQIDDLNRDANKELKKVKNYLKFYPIISIGFKYNI